MIKERQSRQKKELKKNLLENIEDNKKKVH